MKMKTAHNHPLFSDMLIHFLVWLNITYGNMQKKPLVGAECYKCSKLSVHLSILNCIPDFKSSLFIFIWTESDPPGI